MKTLRTYLFLTLILSCSHVLYPQSNQDANNQIQRVRIAVETPMGYTRHLLIGFTPDNAATDGFDYGYDAPNIENFPDDASWLINGDPFVTQGVGAFDDLKKYPIGLFLSNNGNVTFSLFALENFTEPIGVYIYDSLADEYNKINEVGFLAALNPGIYTDRYYLCFKDHNALDENLSVQSEEKFNFEIKYSIPNSVFTLRHNGIHNLSGISFYDLNGKKIFHQTIQSNQTSSFRVELPLSQVLLLNLQTEKGNYSRLVRF